MGGVHAPPCDIVFPPGWRPPDYAYNFGFGNTRQAFNPAETALGTGNFAGVAHLWSYDTGGVINAQPIYLAGVSVGDTTRDLVFVGSESAAIQFALDLSGASIAWTISRTKRARFSSEPPSALTEHWRGPDHTAFQGITLDYLRLTGRSEARIALAHAVARRISPHQEWHRRRRGVRLRALVHRRQPVDFPGAAGRGAAP